MKRTTNLKTQMLFNNIIAIILPVLVLGYISLYIYNSKTEQDIKYDTLIVSRYIDNNVINSIENPISMMKEIGNKFKGTTLKNSDNINEYLITILGMHPYFDTIQVLTEDGAVQNIVPYDNSHIGTNVRNEEFFKNIDKSGKPVFSKVFISTQTQKPTVSITVYSNKSIITANLNLSKITQIISNSKIDSIEHVSIIDNKGTYLVDDNYENVEQRRQFEYFQDIKSSDLKDNSLTKLIDGKKTLLNFFKLDSTGWYCAITVDIDKAYSSVNNLRNLFFTALIVMLIISSLISFYSIKKINIALFKLMDKCKLISIGDYSKDLQHSGYKEFDEIFTNFNVMRNNIHERTLDLISANENLEETNAALEEEISERMRVEEELRKAKKEADSANMAKSQFLANMSHEIRTPMNGIMGMTELAILSSSDARTKEYLNLVMTSAKSLLVIINDVLDYSKIEADKVVLINKPFNLRDILDEIVTLFNITAQQKSLDLITNINSRIPEIVYGDPVRLRQVLSNLIGNAIKFTDKGKVEIEINYTALKAESITVMFIVRDTGIGIPENKRNLLFQRFNQLDSSYTKQFQGTGLGLAISKRLVELMGGNIDFSSEVNVGSEFYFSLEFKIDENEKPQDIVIDNIPFKNTNSNKLILLVEDDKTNQIFMEILLLRMGYTPIIESNGEKALEAYDKYKFDLIIMDINMPVMNGFEATAKIREKEKLTGIHTPIIAATAYALNSDNEKCIQAGMDDYISKPINLSSFTEKINKWIE